MKRQEASDDRRRLHGLASVCGVMAMLMAGATSAAMGQESRNGKAAEVDSVLDRLDRLEQKLLDQEADSARFDEPRADADGLDVKKLNFTDKTPIKGSTPEKERLQNLGAEITVLEQQIDQLEAAVQKSKQGILDDSSVDNFVAIDAQLLDSDVAALNTLLIRLDGHPVYEVKDQAGLWLPAKSVPLFAGPLQPGGHRLDVEARIVIRHQQGLPLNGDIYRFVSKSFDLSIPGGTSHARYMITITPPAKIEDGATAALKEVL